MKIKTILKCLAWVAAMLLISLAIVYGFWLILIFWLFQETALLTASIAGVVFLVGCWIYLVRLAEC